MFSQSEMIVGVKMKVLVVFVLAVLGCSLAEGGIVTKCELRNQLLKAVGNLTVQAKPKALTGTNLVAKLVCHAKLASGFNTSTVNNPEINSDTKEQSNIKDLASTQVRQASQDDEIGMLYGIFQLSNRLVCSDGTTPSPTICGLDCIKLVDDDIHDDISCLLKVFSSLSDPSFSNDSGGVLQIMIGLIFQEECTNVQASVYFAKCPKS